MPALDMNDPYQRGLAEDRKAAGICPTLGPQAATKRRRQERVEELQRRRLAVDTLDRLRTAPSRKTPPHCADSDEYDPYIDMVNSRRRDSLLNLAMKEAFASRRQSRDAMRALAMQEAFDERQALQEESADALTKRDEHRRQALMPVLAQIISVGHSKQLLERSEIGPAPHGFQYIHLE
ncbi:hypothetical protein B0H10DRAFT_2208945 [Mycena sp. CBHHK59/15]|nr:hypothetical protein B0H10DRAFT_2208934 [Mycena sp. CBHHK59/15]KAJ6629018.1 hypothetical protein B0H10DRAFT_2208945 [Mycena sp. CBHHK59/15]